MRITLIQLGKTRFSYLQEGISDYHKRIRHYINFDEITIPDLRNIKNINIPEIRKKEGENILKYIDKSAFLILLDERGKQSSSEELEKAIKNLLPYEIEQLREWLLQFTEEKPELRQCLIYIN